MPHNEWMGEGIEALGEVTWDLLMRITQDLLSRKPGGHLVEAELGSLRDPRERALATEIVMGVLRRRSWLDHLLDSAAPRGLSTIDETTRAILRCGVYQLAFLERVPARAAVSEAVDLSRQSPAPGLSGLVNAVLRNLAARDREDLLPPQDDDGPDKTVALQLGFPGWLFSKAVKALGREPTVAIARAFNRPSRRTLRINPLRTTRAEVLATIDTGVSAGALTPWSIDAADRKTARRLEDQGLAAHQDEGAQLVVLAVDPRPGERILDACAGRGGKTAALAAMGLGRCEITAADRKGSKLQRMSFELDRQGLAARAITADILVDRTALGGPYDRVLLDAPCSGTGTMGRRPEIRWRITRADLRELIQLQAEVKQLTDDRTSWND